MDYETWHYPCFINNAFRETSKVYLPPLDILDTSLGNDVSNWHNFLLGALSGAPFFICQSTLIAKEVSLLLECRALSYLWFCIFRGTVNPLFLV